MFLFIFQQALSLIYTILPALFNLMRLVKSSIVVVVSPIATLMAEQKRKIIPMGINAEFLRVLQIGRSAIQHVTQGLHSLVLVNPKNLLYNSIL
jgi:superfamily II DNA helicase RecQ